MDDKVIIEIPNELTTRHNEKITKIVCSPKLDYVATWSDEDKSACIYSIEDRMNLIFKGYYPLIKQIEHGLSKDGPFRKIRSYFLKVKEYELNLLDSKHIALMPYNPDNPDNSDDRDLRHAAEEIELKQPYIINYRIVFCIDENQLKVQNFHESWRVKLNNMNSTLVAEEVLEEIKKEDEFTEYIESILHYDDWSIKKEQDKINIYIWTFEEKSKIIRLNYFWKFSASYFQKEYKEYSPYLPSPGFEFELKTKNCKKNYDFNELMIEDYVNSRFKLSLYGKDLMEHLLKKNKFESIEKLLKNIIKLTIKNDDKNFISNLPLMRIVTDNFHTLSQYPEIINWFLSRIAFFVPDDTLYEVVNPNSTSSHLQKFEMYNQAIKVIKIITDFS
ncbi:6217_t:CDS:2 [Racocetra fulgida]|uniref:6217_t:CDS:1 n=1 Tax=Racocetra fulgida TaxID=60492 RepID=A0A9N8VJ05_9GLOM|nr:6217_t:CDS:2 [Racocetra fulgida]